MRTTQDTARSRDGFGAAALMLYLVLSMVFFARGVIHDFAAAHVAIGSDPSIFMWCLVWWPYAIANHLNPFFTDKIWVPSGFNVAWSTSIPLQSILTWPLTRAWGPVAAFNVLCLLLPALSAWTAFILCRYIVRQPWISILSGYIYGFSPYILGEQIFGHLHLTAALFVPLFVYVVLVHLDGGITRARFITLMTLLFVLQFLSALEIFATICFCGAIALAIAAVVIPAQARMRIYRLGASIALSLTIALAVLSPYLYYLFSSGASRARIWHGVAFSADFANTLIPPSILFLGGITRLGNVSDGFLNGTIENGAGYIGIPLILIAIMFARAHWREPRGKLLVILSATLYLLCLGPRLHVAGLTLFGLPWKLFEHLPLLNNALPVRFSMYLFLSLAIMTAMWLSAVSFGRGTKVAIGIGTIVSMLPNASAGYWTSTLNTPLFFSSGLYAHYLAKNEVVLLIPFGGRSECMLWQATADIYFRMAGGWTVPIPPEYASWPIMDSFAYGTTLPEAGGQLKAFMANHYATAIILSDNDRDRRLWLSILQDLDVRPIAVAGVSLYKVSASSLEKYRGLTGTAMETRADAARFDALISAANQYVIQRRDIKALSPLQAERLKLLPQDWVRSDDIDISTRNGLWLGPWGANDVGVGIVGSYQSLTGVIEKYRANALHIYYPYPRELEAHPKEDLLMRKLVMVFDTAGLARAARKVNSTTTVRPSSAATGATY
jgi:hypothetical protein